MVYLVGWFLVYFVTSINELLRYRGRFLIVVLLTFFAAVAMLRGEVGTDTAAYTSIFANLSQGFDWDRIEPGFVFFGGVAGHLMMNPDLIVRVVSLIFFLLLLVFVWHSDRNERFFLIAYFIPAFAYQYSMNVLRLAIATALFLLAVQAWRRRDKLSTGIFALASPLFHYSIVFSLVFIYISQIRWRSVSSIVVFLIILVLVNAVASTVLDSYLSSKYILYSEYDSPSSLSGLSKIVPMIVVAAGVLLGALGSADKYKLITLGVGMVIIGIVISQFSYAGLRILDLVSVAFPLSVLTTYSKYNMRFDRSVKVALLLAGLIAAAGVFRGFVLEYGEGPSPFLPYTLFHWG